MKAQLRRHWGLVAGIASDTPRDRLISGGAIALAIYTLGYCLAFLTQLSIARHLGAEAYGLYAYVLAWATVMAYVAALGFNVSILRFVPVYLADRSWGLLVGFLRFADRRVFGFGTVLAICGTAVVLLLSASRTADEVGTFLVGLLSIPAFGLLIVRCAGIRALGGVAASLAPNRLVREGFVLIVILGARLVGATRSAFTVMTVTLIGILLALMYASRATKQHLPDAAHRASPEFAKQVWWPATLPLLVVTAVEALFDKTGTLVLGLLGAGAEAGIFALAFNLALLAIVPRTAIDTIFAPTLARLHTQRNLREVQRVIAKAAILSFAGAALVAMALVLAADFILARFGDNFGAAKLPLLVLLAGQVFAAASGSQLLVLSMTGYERRAANILLRCALANIMLCGLLVPQLAATGAALATTVSLVAWNVLMSYEISRKLALRPGIFSLFPSRDKYYRTATVHQCDLVAAEPLPPASSPLLPLQPEGKADADRSN